MKEASVLAPFHKKVKERLRGSIVVKHRDASMIGMVDTSITFQGRTLWAEGKLYALPRSGDPGPDFWRAKAMQESPAQARMVSNYNCTSACIYIIWIKKTCVYIGYDVGKMLKVADTPRAVERIKVIFDNWQRGPLLFRPSLFTTPEAE